MFRAKPLIYTRTAFFLNLTFTVVELIGGFLSGSIAIMAGSLHDFADCLSLGEPEKKTRNYEEAKNFYSDSNRCGLWNIDHATAGSFPTRK
jgi:hypothetical protein